MIGFLRRIFSRNGNGKSWQVWWAGREGKRYREFAKSLDEAREFALKHYCPMCGRKGESQ